MFHALPQSSAGVAASAVMFGLIKALKKNGLLIEADISAIHSEAQALIEGSGKTDANAKALTLVDAILNLTK